MTSAASGGNELILVLPDDSSITYAVEDRELHRTAGESQMTLAQNISNISFSVENRFRLPRVWNLTQHQRDN